MYQPAPMIVVSLFNQLLELEKVLEKYRVEYPIGLYTKYQFDPIISPKQGNKKKGYYIHVEGVDDYVSDYYKLIKKIEEVVSKGDQIEIYNEDSELLIRDVRELLTRPYLPIRAQQCVKHLLFEVLDNTRKWNNSVENAIDNAYKSYIKEYIPKDLDVEQILDIKDDISIALSGLFEEIACSIKRYGWEILTIDIHNDVFRIFSMGDYRIEKYMTENERTDY